jgi:rare lipoprotein A
LKTKRFFSLLLALSVLLWATGCAHISRIPSPGWQEKGTASWYGEDFHGKTTSSGEVYNMYGLSAAHKTLPLGTKVKVTNLSNGKSVIVPINDRGPFVGNRIIDMSYGAAKELDMVEAGLAEVRIEVLDVPLFAENKYTLQFGAYIDNNNASVMAEKIKSMGYSPSIEEVMVHDKKFYRVRMGKFDNMDNAEKMARKFESSGVTCIVMAL